MLRPTSQFMVIPHAQLIPFCEPVRRMTHRPRESAPSGLPQPAIPPGESSFPNLTRRKGDQQSAPANARMPVAGLDVHGMGQAGCYHLSPLSPGPAGVSQISSDTHSVHNVEEKEGRRERTNSFDRLLPSSLLRKLPSCGNGYEEIH